MEIRQLRYFLAVYQCGSITRAASELYIAQQTLSKQLREFEQELGVPLFVRNKRGVEPTEYAKNLLAPAKQIIKTADHAQRVLDEMRCQKPVTVRLGVVWGDYNEGSPISPRKLFEWEREFPQISLEVREYDPQELDGMLLREELELACTLNGDENPALCKFLIDIQPGYILVSKGNPLSRCQEITAEVLREQYFLEPREYSPQKLTSEGFSRTAGSLPQKEINVSEPDLPPNKRALITFLGFMPQFRIFNGSFDQGVERVRANEGILLSSRGYCLAQNLNGLAALPLPIPQLKFCHYLAYKKGRRLPEPVRRLIENSKELCKGMTLKQR